MLFVRRSLADASVTELISNMDEQMADDESPLRTGNVTLAAKGFVYSTSIGTASPSTDASTTAIGLSVLEYQEKGLFGFESLVWYATEASGEVTLTVLRNHGTKGVMDIGYTTFDGSATGGEDYVVAAGTIRFYDGDTSRALTITLMDDERAEAHFETYTVALSLQGPINDGAALMSGAAKASVLIYDYGDGTVLAETTFSAAAASFKPVSEDELALNWTVTDNGGHAAWVDARGLAAKDAIVGADEYGREHEALPRCIRTLRQLQGVFKPRFGHDVLGYSLKKETLFVSPPGTIVGMVQQETSLVVGEWRHSIPEL